MARLPRLTVTGYPHHLILRGNNRQAIFRAQEDRREFLDLLQQRAKEFGVAIHSYVLMDNHVHILATPQRDAGIPNLMQAVGRRYVRHFNDKYGRTGTLWEGRYKSALVQSERYLLACMIYIDLNPVRAGLVSQAQEYAWSSCAHYTGRKTDPLLTPHPLVWELGNTPFAREAAYAVLLQNGVTQQQQTELTSAAMGGWALGDKGFVTALQAAATRRVVKAKAGRPVSRPTTP